MDLWFDANRSYVVVRLPRSRRHTRSHESAVGVSDVKENSTIVHEGIQG